MERTVPPLNVSPLIKTARWGFLFAGFMYGVIRYRTLYSMEQKRLAELERTRPEREAKAKLLKEKISKEQLEQLQKDIGSSL